MQSSGGSSRARGGACQEELRQHAAVQLEVSVGEVGHREFLGPGLTVRNEHSRQIAVARLLATIGTDAAMASRSTIPNDSPRMLGAQYTWAPRNRRAFSSSVIRPSHSMRGSPEC